MQGAQLRPLTLLLLLTYGCLVIFLPLRWWVKEQKQTTNHPSPTSENKRYLSHATRSKKERLRMKRCSHHRKQTWTEQSLWTSMRCDSSTTDMLKKALFSSDYALDSRSTANNHPRTDLFICRIPISVYLTCHF